MFKKIIESRLFRFAFSVVLIYFAFQKIDVVELFKEIRQVPWWFVLINIFLSFLIVFLMSTRWGLLLFPKINFKTIWTFTRSNFLATFYSLFFSTAAVGDVAKWIAIDYKYPEISKTRILGTVVLDRFIGFSVFMFTGLLSAIIGRSKGLLIPDYIFYLFIVLAGICLAVYVVIYFFDIHKILPNFRFLRKLDDAFDVFKNRDRNQMAKCLFMSMLSEVTWMLQIWLINWKFGVGLDVLSIFVFVPIISIILLLPISIGGFGAREQLYLFFFSQSGGSQESILLLSAFLGILGVINSLFGGVLLFFDQETRKKMKD
jgi:uncharacterized membrane protein YbhN (UPF0104 family)